HYPVGRWRAAWELAYPRPFAAIVAAETKRSGIPEALAYAIMREESAFDPKVASHAQAYGLMQLIVPTAKRMAKPLGLPWSAEALRRPEVNVALGCRFLSVLRNQFSDNPLLAIPAYNAGGGAPKRWIAERPSQSFDLWVERIPYEETRLYTKRVLTSL
ncbi:lytic transglycosylase domain-containing protein, partial [Aeromonas sp. EERV15]|uniref:lytic transglycosylase domain-containing protein n=1 Tax=Aeromonas sp. EERV15 TaxID=1833892 RepID=UPI001146EEAE